MCKWFASLPVALPIVGLLAASAVGLLAAVSAQAEGRATQPHYGVSSTPSGAGTERPLL